MKDRLFMLRPGFYDGESGPFYCGDSAEVEGLLSFFPGLRAAVDVHYIEAPRPRTEIVALIGEGYQSAPVLVLSPHTQVKDTAIAVSTYGTARFIDNPVAIRAYLSSQYGFASAA